MFLGVENIGINILIANNTWHQIHTKPPQLAIVYKASYHNRYTNMKNRSIHPRYAKWAMFPLTIIISSNISFDIFSAGKSSFRQMNTFLKVANDTPNA